MIGAPCLRCGDCCRAHPCAFGISIFRSGWDGRREPCPALAVEGGRASCGLVTRPEAYISIQPGRHAVTAALIRKYLGIGAGCRYKGPR